MLHAARLGGIGLRIVGRSRLLIDKYRRHAAASQLVGEHQSTGATARNQDAGTAGNVVRLHRMLSSIRTCRRR